MSELNFGYWGYPFKGQPVRYLLELGKYKYKDTQYTDRDQWFAKDKEALGLDFPNLPYVIHGEIKLTESQNIVNYVLDVTKQTHLLGQDKTRFKIDNIRFFCDELIGKLFVVFTKQGEERKKEIETNIIPKVKLLEKDLDKKAHFFNNTLTLADVYAYAAIDLFQQLCEEEFKPFNDSFKSLLEEFRKIPQIKAYIESDRCPKMKK